MREAGEGLVKLPALLTAALDWAIDRLLGAMSKSAPEPERAPGQLDSRDVAIQNRASHVPEAHKVPGNVTRLPAPPRVPKVPSSRYD